MGAEAGVQGSPCRQRWWWRAPQRGTAAGSAHSRVGAVATAGSPTRAVMGAARRLTGAAATARPMVGAIAGDQAAPPPGSAFFF